MPIKRKKNPYKIGDKVQCENGKVMEITDIFVTTSIKTRKSHIKLQLDGHYMLDTRFHDIEIQKK